MVQHYRISRTYKYGKTAKLRSVAFRCLLLLKSVKSPYEFTEDVLVMKNEQDLASDTPEGKTVCRETISYTNKLTSTSKHLGASLRTEVQYRKANGAEHTVFSMYITKIHTTRRASKCISCNREKKPR
jgi:hypothetical protein